MNIPFVYNRPVSGQNFVGRKQDVATLSNLIREGESVLLSSPPKTGKSSLLQEALLALRSQGLRVVVASLSVLDVRTLEDFLCRYGDAVLQSFASSPSEFREIFGNFLKGTHFVFDSAVYADKGVCVSMNWDADSNDVSTMIRLPFLLAGSRGASLVVQIDRFDHIGCLDDADTVFNAMAAALEESHGMLGRPACSYVLMSSRVNAMKQILRQSRRMDRCLEKFVMQPVQQKDIMDYIFKVLNTAGKVADRDQMEQTCALLCNNVWYMNQFVSICDSLSRGYIMDIIFKEAMDTLVAVHEPRFCAVVEGLTTFQLSLLRAILDGVSRFSGSEIIEKYHLNSSANVKRLKEALCAKEIVCFSESDDVSIQDPLFEYWLRNEYYKG